MKETRLASNITPKLYCFDFDGTIIPFNLHNKVEGALHSAVRVSLNLSVSKSLPLELREAQEKITAYISTLSEDRINELINIDQLIENGLQQNGGNLEAAKARLRQLGTALKTRMETGDKIVVTSFGTYPGTMRYVLQNYCGLSAEQVSQIYFPPSPLLETETGRAMRVNRDAFSQDADNKNKQILNAMTHTNVTDKTNVLFFDDNERNIAAAVEEGFVAVANYSCGIQMDTIAHIRDGRVIVEPPKLLLSDVPNLELRRRVGRNKLPSPMTQILLEGSTAQCNDNGRT